MEDKRHRSFDNIPAEIVASRDRCRQSGLDPRGNPRRVSLGQTELDRRRDELQPVLDMIRTLVGGFTYVNPQEPRQVYFLDGEGYVLDTIDSGARGLQIGFPWATIGECWLESVMGTNAGALSMLLGQPVKVSGEQHYLDHLASCASCSAPFRDPEGQIAGALVFTVCDGNMHQTIPYMAMSSVQIVEREVALKQLASRQAEQNRRLGLLNEVAQLFTTVECDEETLSTIANRIGALIGAAGVQLYSLATPNVLLPLGGWPGRGTMLEVGPMRLSEAPSVLRGAVETREVATEANSLCVPVIFNRTVSGVILLDNDAARGIDDDGFIVLRAAANQFGAFLERTQLHRSLVQESHKLRATLDNVDVGVVIIDVSDGSFVWNHRLDDYFQPGRPAPGDPSPGLCPERYMRWPIRFSSGDPEWSIKQILAGGESVTEEAVLLADYPRTFRVTTGPVGGQSGQIRWVVRTYTDVTRYRELERTKSELIAMISHELRTPVTAILGYAELLTRLGTSRPQESRHLIDGLSGEAGELAGLVERVLAVTRLDIGLDRGAFREVDLGSLLVEIVDLLSLEANTKGVSITTERKGDLRVMGDREGLRRAFTNLVQNAVKFSSPDSVIRVDATKITGGVEVTVADEGPGIPGEHLGRIFERFYRVPAAETVGLPGCGLGLYIVKGVVQQHGGHVLAESELGQGTVFRVFLPGWEDESVEEKASTGR